MKSKWDFLVTSTLVVCAVITTGLVIYRQFFDATAGPGIPAPQKTVLVEDWKSHVGEGAQLGSSSAPVQLIEFADFECPFCGSFHKTLKELRARYPEQIALSYVHFPLPGHRFAEPAARVAECAGAQDRFEAMHDRLFEEQDQIGLKPWSEFAQEAGVADLGTFDACIKDTAPVAKVEAGKQLGNKLDIRGTPTLIVNGWKLGQPPSAADLDKMVKAILAGKNPVSESN